MSDDQISQAQNLALQLRAEGHHDAAEQVQAAVGGTNIGDELRLEIDKRLLR